MITLKHTDLSRAIPIVGLVPGKTGTTSNSPGWFALAGGIPGAYQQYCAGVRDAVRRHAAPPVTVEKRLGDSRD